MTRSHQIFGFKDSSTCNRTPGAAVLDLQDVAVVQGSFRLGPISLRLRGGDYLLLTGPSGCGKTTLLKAIAGVLPVAGGEIAIGGRRVDGLVSRRRQVGYVPQHSLLFPHLTVAGNVRFGLRYAAGSRAERESRFAEVVGLAGIAGLLGRFPATLSGGEARRVALARALAIRPAVLLLDEPLSMLDPGARAELLAALRGIRDRTGVVALHVTHQREEAAGIATRGAMLRAGRIFVDGSGGGPGVDPLSPPVLPGVA